MSTTTITKRDAMVEIARRKAPKGSAIRNRRPARHIMEASNDLLLGLVGHVAKPEAPAKAPTKAARKAARKADPTKADAKAAFDAAFAAAEDGDRRRAGGKAYRLVLNGTPLATVLAAIEG